MPRPATAAVTVLSALQLQEVRRYLQSSLYLQAYLRTRQLGPLESWVGAEARALAGRLAIHLGARRLGRRLHLLGCRQAPANAEAFFHYVTIVFELRGGWEAWQVLRNHRELRNNSPEQSSNLAALRARITGQLRDFEVAEGWLAKAEELTPKRPWLAVERALLLEKQDRYEEALEAARRPLRTDPAYRPAIQAVARLLQLLGRAPEAIEVLTQAIRTFESGAVATQLALLQQEHGLHAESMQSLNRFEEVSPLLEPDGVEWLNLQRADAAYLSGQLLQAAEWAQKSRSKFYQEFAQRCRNGGGDPPRRILGVSFIRQSHMTCAPATLAALSQFWNKQVDPIEVANKICYNGTVSHAQRHWANENGFLTREFTLTRESALALIDRGVPCALSTLEATSGHLQALIGYDLWRDTFIIRDPTLPDMREFNMGPFLERYRSSGPRALVIVPAEQSHRIEGLNLLDAALYDLLYKFDRSLHQNERGNAAALLAQMRAEAPEHRLTCEAGQGLAAYDNQWPELLLQVEKLLALFPSEARLQLALLACLRQLRPRDERVAWLKEVCEAKGSDPSLWLEYASELCVDARDHATARRWLKRVGRIQPEAAAELTFLAGLDWNRNETALAMELYRFAACGDDKNEGRANNYFHAACAAHQSETALKFLRDRFERFATKAHQPARTLFWAYCQLYQTSAAFGVLDEALQKRSDDGELLLFAADACARFGKLERSRQHLAAAQGRTAASSWKRVSAQLELYGGERMAALALWREILAAEPVALDAHGQVARLLAESEGHGAALQHLESICAQFPHHFGLHLLWSDFLRETDYTRREQVVQKLLAINPTNLRCHQGLVSCLSGQGRNQEALAALEQALKLSPGNPDLLNHRGWLLRKLNRIPEARESFRQAVRRSSDHIGAMKGLIELSTTLMAHAEVTTFVRGVLIDGSVAGETLLNFRHLARSLFTPQDLLGLLTAVLEARPELWSAWSVVIQQLLDLQQHEPALARAEEAVRRFPQVAALHTDLGRVYGALGRVEEEMQSLRQAVQLDPSSLYVARLLAQAYETANRLPEARQILEEAVASAPLEAVNRGCLANILWKQNEKEAALECAQKAARSDLNYDWAWQAVQHWGRELKKPQLALEMAREVTLQRSGDAQAWILLSHHLTEPAQQEERLETLRRAVQCDPLAPETHNALAQALTLMNCLDEAAAAARPPVFGTQIPPVLQLRAMSIEAQRGKRKEVIVSLRAFLLEHPDYSQGWAELSNWLAAEGDCLGAIEAGETLARLEPLSAEAQVRLAKLESALEHRDSAKGHYRRAVRLDPKCEEASRALLEMQLADHEMRPARETLDQMRQGGLTSQLMLCEILYTLYSRETKECLDWLRVLAASAGSDHEALVTAGNLMVSCGLAVPAEEVLAAAMVLPEANPQVGGVWAKLRMARGHHDCLKQLNTFLEKGESGRDALVAYADELGVAGHDFIQQGNRRGARRCLRLLKRLMTRHQSWLRDHALGYRVVAIALANLNQPKAIIAWMSDWKDRSNVSATTLIWLVFALQSTRQSGRAVEICRHALEKLNRDRGTPLLEMWLALEEALAGDTSTAEKRLALLRVDQFEPFYQSLFALANALVETARASSEDRRKVCRRVLDELRSGFPSRLARKSDVALRHLYRRTVSRLAQFSGDWRLTLWRLAHR